jgi:hypothetical protein
MMRNLRKNMAVMREENWFKKFMFTYVHEYTKIKMKKNIIEKKKQFKLEIKKAKEKREHDLKLKL